MRLTAVDPFGEAEARYRVLADQRRRGEMDARSFRRAVRELTVADGEGREWVIAPENGTWYRRHREGWLPDDPPRRLVCPTCKHHNLPRHSFCVECGKRLTPA